MSVSLGIVTSIGGFLDVGSIATSAQAGAAFGFSLLWSVLLGTICAVFLMEMAGRFSAVSRHTMTDAMRKRFGFPLFVVPFAAATLTNVLVLASELGGICIALQMVSGISFRIWAIPAGLAVWLLLWLGTFDEIENGTALLGLVTLSFVAAAIVLRPGAKEVLGGFLPALPSAGLPQYLFLAVSILGATLTPYMFTFYSSGAIEDKWDKSFIGANRAISIIGMAFGSVISMAVLVGAAVVLQPKGIMVDDYQQAAQMLVAAFGDWGFYLFVGSLAVAAAGAALEVSLANAYGFAQGFGWNWGESLKPAKAARFSFVYTVSIALAALILTSGLDPLRLTLFSMALAALILPLFVVPFLVLMNDPKYMGEYRNGKLSNAVVVFTIFLSALLAVVAIPLELIGGQ